MVGSRCLLLAGAHVAHDCWLGDQARQPAHAAAATAGWATWRVCGPCLAALRPWDETLRLGHPRWQVILSNGVLLGGHVSMGSFAVVSGAAAVAQRCAIGQHAFVAGGAMLDGRRGQSEAPGRCPALQKP